MEKCRFCLRSLQESRKLEINNEVKTLFKDVTNTKLKDSAIFPKFSCSTCISQLENCSSIKATFVEKQKILYESLENSNTRVLRKRNSEAEILNEIGDSREDSSILNKAGVSQDNPPTSKESSKNLDTSTSSFDKPRFLRKRQLKDKIEDSQIFNESLQCSKPRILGKRKLEKNDAVNNSKESKDSKMSGDSQDFESDVILEESSNCANSNSKGQLKSKKWLEKPKNTELNLPCKDCGKLLKKQNHKEHYERVHLNLKSFICDLCLRGFYRKVRLEEHLKSHLKIKDIECNECELKFTSRNHMLSHKKVIHRGIKIIQSKTCHLCGKTFQSKTFYDNHIRSKHTGERPFKCDYKDCEKTYFSAKHLAIHKKDFHSGFVKCSICLKTVKNLTRHMKNHQDKKFVCNFSENGQICNKSYISNAKLKHHFNVHHRGIRNFTCLECNTNYSAAIHLTRHIRTVHQQFKIKCELCLTKLTRKDYYKRHVILHHKELDEGTRDNLLLKIKNTSEEELYRIKQS